MKHVLRKQNYYLLKELVKADFKIRYQGSVLGYLWSLLRPLALFTVLYLVFARFLKLGTGVPFFPAYLLLGIVLWTFFTDATNNGLRAIVDKGDMLRKVKVPTYALVLTSTFSAFINLAFNFSVVLLFLYLSGGHLGLTSLAFPLVVLEVFALALSTAFLLSGLFVRYRDIQYIWEVGLQVLFYASAIIYPLASVPLRFQKLIILSPLSQTIQDARYLLVTKQSTTIWQLYHNPFARTVPFLLLCGWVAISVAYFKSRSKYFAEEL